jgi:NADH-dependent peroxiredoxin subunit F
MLYDLIIIGGGPAGITAAIYAARRKLNFLILSENLGGQMIWSSNVENYPGFHLMSGADLTKKFEEHMKDYSISLKYEEVMNIRKKGKTFVVKTENSEYDTISIIITTGKKPKKLGIPDEDKYLGKGLSYCATCDATFFKDKDVVVIGGKNSAFDACIILSKYAKKIYLLDIEKKLSGEPIMREKALNNKKVCYIPEAKVVEIIGDKSVKGLKYIKDNKIYTLNLEGIFVEIGLDPNSDFIDIVEKNKEKEIMIYNGTKPYEQNITSVKGIFAAGDVTNTLSKQIIIAAGDGCKAALASFNYINMFKKV